MYSLASMATMAACIFMFGIFFCLVENVNYIVEIAESGVAVTAFFDEGMKESEILEIGEKIESRSEVSEMVYVSAEEAWEEYKEVYFSENPQLAEGFADDNPLANSAHFEIYVKDVELQDELVTYIESIEGVRKINQSEDIANILSDFNVLIGYASIAIIGLLLAVFSTILGHSVFSWCLKYFSPSFVSASKLCEPVVAAVLAGFLFGELPGAVQILGGILILGGVLWYSRIEQKVRV